MMSCAWRWGGLLVSLWVCGCAGGPPAAPETMAKAELSDYVRHFVTAPPASLHLDPFYQKYVAAEGIPVIASAKVPDAAVLVARDIVVAMLSERKDLRDGLIAKGSRVGIMAIDESTMDIPEQRDWKKPAKDDQRLTNCERVHYDETIGRMSDYEYWAKRARGMGGTFTTGAAENILGVPGTRYYGENILVHEFSHNIFDTVRTVDPKLAQDVEAAYAKAKASKLWIGAYMEVTLDEYWAEGTQFWFNSNKAYRYGDVTVLDDTDFKTRDPALYAILAKVYRADHHIPADVYYKHPARMDSPPISLKAACT